MAGDLRKLSYIRVLNRPISSSTFKKRKVNYFIKVLFLPRMNISIYNLQL